MTTEFEQELKDYVNTALREMIEKHETGAEIHHTDSSLFEVFDETFKINWPDYKLLSVEFNDDETMLTFEYDEPEEALENT